MREALDPGPVRRARSPGPDRRDGRLHDRAAELAGARRGPGRAPGTGASRRPGADGTRRPHRACPPIRVLVDEPTPSDGLRGEAARRPGRVRRRRLRLPRAGAPRAAVERRLDSVRRRQLRARRPADPASAGNGTRIPWHGRAGPSQPEVHVRDLRHRCQQPFRSCGGRRGGGGAGEGLQPALRLRRIRAGEDAPAARHRALRAQPVPGGAGAVRELGGVHQRLHQQHPRRQGERVPAPLPGRGRAADRRHPVPPGQGADPGGVLPHVQHPPQREQTGGHHLATCRPSSSRASRSGCGRGSSGV